MGNGNNGSKGGNLLSRVAYSFGNVGQSAFYNALSTYFIVYVTSSLFSGVDKSVSPCPAKGTTRRTAAVLARPA